MNELPTRPHPPPCACDACVAWAKVIVSTPTERRYDPAKRAADILRGPAPDVGPLGDFAESVIAVAERATGKSRAWLLSEAAKMAASAAAREDAATPKRPTRETVAGRGVPELHLCNVYDREPEACSALQAVRWFLAGSQTVVVLSGGVGTRKTGSACWALTQRSGTFTSANEAIRASASKLPDDIERWRRIRATQLLVLDDLGGEYVDDKGFRVAQVNALFDERYGAKAKTIVTTNLDSKAFRATYGERVSDRIRESDGWKPIGGESIRREIARAQAGSRPDDGDDAA